MAKVVGHIAEIYEDGTCRVETSSATDQTYFGRISVIAGGGLIFTSVDTRTPTVAEHGVPAVVEAAESERVEMRATPQKQRVRVGNKR